MAIFILNADSNTPRGALIEKRLQKAVSNLIKIDQLEDLKGRVAAMPGERTYVVVIVPTNNPIYVKQFIEIASRRSDPVFFILMGDEISTSEYKAVLRTGRADWVSATADPAEILEIVAKSNSRLDAMVESGANHKAVVVSLVPSAGGVGNATLSVEVGVSLNTSKATRGRKVCIVDLDFQGSHVCDYLDIEPRLLIQEISNNPKRLDAHLFDIFISRHASGLHVFAAPRSKFDVYDLNVDALDRFFEMVSMRYDLIIIDLPPTWFAWTPQIISVSHGIIVTGLNTIPSLRQTAETLAAVREAVRADAHVAVVINRCVRHLMGGVARRSHVETVLGNEQVFYVGEEPGAINSINAGAPMALTSAYRTIGKDVAALATFFAELKVPDVVVAKNLKSV
jgi:pilus assembly protein CpaE